MKTDDTETNKGNAFPMMLQSHRRGRVVHKASRLLTEAIQASKDTGLVSEVTMKVKIKPQDSTGEQVIMDVQVTNKLPVEKEPAALFWVDDDCSLHTSDPRQSEMELREVDKKSDLKDVPSADAKEA